MVSLTLSLRPASDKTVAFPTYHVASNDQVDDGVFEVNGPPEKQPRLSTDIHADDDSHVTTVPALQQRSLVSEECNIIVHDDRTQVATFDATTSPPTKSMVPDETPPTLEASIAINTAIFPDDDPNEVAQDLTAPKTGDPIVTQDEDVDPDILESITHQLTRSAEDSTNDELFTSIEDHEWQDGTLHFRVKWTTDKVSTVTFNLIKRDYPTETASNILNN